MDRKFRLASVGLGHRGRAILKGVISGFECIEAVATCDLNADLYYKPAHFFYGGDVPPLKDELPESVKFYQDFDEMLDKEKIDILLVETPARCHAEFCAKGLKRNIHVFSDIPSVASLQEADMLWKAQKESGAMLMTGATTCGWGFVQGLQDIYKQGFLGKPYFLEAEYIHNCRELWEETPWRKPGYDKTSYAQPCYYCTHSLGPLLSIMDEDLRKVTAFSTGSHVTDIPEANDVNVAMFSTDSNVMIRHTNSFINNCTTGLHSFRVFGTEGYFEHLSKRGNRPPTTAFSSNKIYAMREYTELPVKLPPYGLKCKKPFGHEGADAYLWESFLDTLLKGGTKAPMDLKAGLRMTMPGMYAVQSIVRGSVPMTIHYPWDADWEQYKDEFKMTKDVK